MYRQRVVCCEVRASGKQIITPKKKRKSKKEEKENFHTICGLLSQRLAPSFNLECIWFYEIFEV
ncbi:MAG: hypothetical protein P3M73_00200 [Candidatus Hodgkinia cicadicola]|nr:MAG: hypothetical protein P3M73_00200 [Candidatus Hodgkinia cicadicola]